MSVGDRKEEAGTSRKKCHNSFFMLFHVAL